MAGFTKNCGCCCKDVCLVKEDSIPQDMFNGLSPKYEFNGSSRFDIGPVTGLDSNCLRLHPSDTGTCFLRLGAGPVQGRRIKINCAVKPYAGERTDTYTQKYGIFVSNAFSAMLSCNSGSGTFENGATFQIYSGVDENGAGGVLEYEQVSTSYNNGYLTIEINYDGLTPSLYGTSISWSFGFGAEHDYLTSITFPVTDTEIRIGHRGENGGAWDQSCIVFNHNAGTCFPCLGCKQSPKENFPSKWLLSFPELDQSGSACDFCELLQGDFELIYYRSHVVAQGSGLKMCGWYSLEEGSPCANLPYLTSITGTLWCLTFRGLEATNGVNVLKYDLYGEPGVTFNCNGPNVYRFNCFVCSVFQDGEYVETCAHPEFLTVTPVFGS